MSFLASEIQNTLKENCCVKIVLSKSGLSRGFAFITVPDHMCTELIKLNEIDFNSHRLTIEEAQVKPKLKESLPSRNKTTETKNYQTPFEEVRVVPGERTYSKATRSHNSVFNTIIFTESIPKGTQMHKFNRLIQNRKTKMFNFPGASPHQLLHYLDVHLNDKSINTVIIHNGINDLLTNSSRSGMDNLIYNIKKITEKYLMFGVKSVFISGLVYTTRVDVSLLERIHVLIFDFCRKNHLYR